MKFTINSFDAFVDSGTVLNNYAHVFDLLLRLRQSVDHPYLVLFSKGDSTAGGNYWCSLCQEPSEDPIMSKCKHIFCRSCMENYVQVAMKTKCPDCHVTLTIDLEQPNLLLKETDSKYETSAKTYQNRYPKIWKSHQVHFGASRFDKMAVQHQDRSHDE